MDLTIPAIHLNLVFKYKAAETHAKAWVRGNQELGANSFKG